MQQRKLGNTGLSVSAIGFGCWEMGNPEYGSSNDNEMIAAVHRAIDLGVTLFDTAPNYGFGGSEEVLGRALGARRNDIILVTKSDATHAGGPKMVAFTVSYRGGDPGTVAQVTNTLASLFIDEHLKIRARQHGAAHGQALTVRPPLQEVLMCRERDLQVSRNHRCRPK